MSQRSCDQGCAHEVAQRRLCDEHSMCDPLVGVWLTAACTTRGCALMVLTYRPRHLALWICFDSTLVELPGQLQSAVASFQHRPGLKHESNIFTHWVCPYTLYPTCNMTYCVHFCACLSYFTRCCLPLAWSQKPKSLHLFVCMITDTCVP